MVSSSRKFWNKFGVTQYGRIDEHHGTIDWDTYQRQSVRQSGADGAVARTGRGARTEGADSESTGTEAARDQVTPRVAYALDNPDTANNRYTPLGTNQAVEKAIVRNKEINEHNRKIAIQRGALQEKVSLLFDQLLQEKRTPQGNAGSPSLQANRDRADVWMEEAGRATPDPRLAQDRAIKQVPFLRQQESTVRALLSKVSGTADWALPLMLSFVGRQSKDHRADNENQEIVPSPPSESGHQGTKTGEPCDLFHKLMGVFFMVENVASRAACRSDVPVCEWLSVKEELLGFNIEGHSF